MSKILIHTTSIVEANPIIDFFKLKKLDSIKNNPFYTNDKILLIISGVSKNEILESLDYIFKNYKISKAFDLSITSCSDGTIKLGTLFCTNRFINGVNFANVTTLEEPLESDEKLETLLVDKQAKFFRDKCKENIQDYYIFKIVSDYFDEVELKDENIFNLIDDSIKKWENLI